MAINKAKTVLYWNKIRVGCKRSAPNRENAPPVKKTKLHQEEIIPDWEEPEKEVTADNTLSVSADENRSKDVPYDTSETHFSENGSQFSAEGVEEGSNEGSNLDHLESLPCYNTNGTHLSAKGVNPYLPDSHSRYNTNGSHFSAEGSCSNLPDLHPQNKATKGSTKNEESTEAESQVDRWVCRVCKESEVSIVVLPCSHLCMCWVCHLETYSCPICGKDMTAAFYVRTD